MGLEPKLLFSLRVILFLSYNASKVAVVIFVAFKALQLLTLLDIMDGVAMRVAACVNV